MRARFLALALLPTLAVADNTPQTVPFSQNWSNTGLITTNDVWTGVPGISGYQGADASTTTAGIDPRTVLTDNSNVLDVEANLTMVSPTAGGGTGEFESPLEVVGLKGSGTSDAPYLLISINNTGRSGTKIAFNARDLDGGVTDAVQPLNVQYRLAATGAFTNLAGGYFADVTQANATPSTAVDLTLPAETDNQAIVQIRIMTTNAGGNDEWLGIDDIVVGTAADVPPTVATTVPAAAGSVAFNANLQVNFSEAVTTTGNWFTLTCATSGAHTATVTGGPANYTLDPSPDFAFGENCTLTVLAANVSDTDGTADPMAANFVLNFSVLPDNAPSVTTTVPANNATGVALASDLTVNFSEPVSVTGNWYTLSCTTAGNNLSAVQSGGPTSFVLNPNANFVNDDSCTLTIIANNVLDQDGTPNAMASNVVVSFQTAPSGANYYASVDATSCTSLRSTLHALIDDHTVFPYTGNPTDVWRMIESGDEDPNNNGNVLDIYFNKSFVKVTDRDNGTNVAQGTRYNREHTWPQSLGFSSENGNLGFPNAPRTDAHHLFASEKDWNADRGRKPFANCPPPGCASRFTLTHPITGGAGTAAACDHASGNCNWVQSPDDSTGNFEVWTRRKGDVARAIMYMDVRYEGGTAGAGSNTSGQSEPDLILTDDRSLIQITSNSPAYMGTKSALRAWHSLDQVDAREIERNNRIQGFQGNRNPFVDNPQWACLFDTPCSCGTQAEEIFKNGFE